MDVYIKKPNFLLEIISSELRPNQNFLDLGCGQGQDLFFISNKGLLSVGVDFSKTAIKQIKSLVKKEKISNVFVKKYDIAKFPIEKNKFDIIQSINVLNFIAKKDAIRVINLIQLNLKNKGYVVISVFTKHDPAFKIRSKKLFKCAFESQELLKLFKPFKIIYYLEKKILDKGHLGFTKPHWHSVQKIIAQKIIL